VRAIVICDDDEQRGKLVDTLQSAHIQATPIRFATEAISFLQNNQPIRERHTDLAMYYISDGKPIGEFCEDARKAQPKIIIIAFGPKWPGNEAHGADEYLNIGYCRGDVLAIITNAQYSKA